MQFRTKISELQFTSASLECKGNYFSAYFSRFIHNFQGIQGILRAKFYIHKFRSKSLMFSCYFIPTRPYYVFFLKKGLGSRMFSRDTTGGGRLQFTVS